MTNTLEQYSIQVLTEESDKIHTEACSWSQEKTWESYSTSIKCFLKSRDKLSNPFHYKKRNYDINFNKDNFKRILLNLEFNPSQEEPFIKFSMLPSPPKADKKYLQKLDKKNQTNRCKCLSIDNGICTSSNIESRCDSPDCLMKMHKPQRSLLSFPKREHIRIPSYTPSAHRFLSPKSDHMSIRRAGCRSTSPECIIPKTPTSVLNTCKPETVVKDKTSPKPPNPKMAPIIAQRSELRLPFICRSLIC
ncbi:unnamed protein product [Blepharisma stoltei]|uniref:Uncharacterized protein n=1 Tax=Blepharisma stoltei TaxID=1481888 RepID=A0AAU9JP98_9CILI|nr:unnamed protein product [Blepharisma stoltei]